MQEVAQLENQDCVAALLPQEISLMQLVAGGQGRKYKNQEKKNLLLFKEKYEAGDYMHPQRSTQGPQPLGGIITVIAGLALQIVFTNFLLSPKITFKFSRNGTCANFVR